MLRTRAQIYMNLGELDRALSDIDETIRLQPEFHWNYQIRAQLHDKRGEFGRAIADYSEVIERNPELAVALNNRAWILATCPSAELRDGDRAVEDALKTVALDRTAGYLDTLAAAYAEAGRFDEAVKVEEEVCRLSDQAEFRALVEVYRSGRTYAQWKAAEGEE